MFLFCVNISLILNIFIIQYNTTSSTIMIAQPLQTVASMVQRTDTLSLGVYVKQLFNTPIRASFQLVDSLSFSSRDSSLLQPSGEQPQTQDTQEITVKDIFIGVKPDSDMKGQHLPEHMELRAEEGLKVPLRLPHELQPDSVTLAQPYTAQQQWLHPHGSSPPFLSGLALLFKK